MNKTNLLPMKSIIEKITLSWGSSPLFYSSSDYKLLSHIKQFSADSHGILIQYLDFSSLYSIDYDYGSNQFNNVIDSIHSIITEHFLKALPENFTLLSIESLINEDIIIFYTSNQDLTYYDFYELDTRLRLALLHHLEYNFPLLSRNHLDIKTGHAFFSPQDKDNILTRFFSCIKASIKNAKKQNKSMSASIIAQFEKILKHENLHHHFQPIISLNQGTTLGYEALARGPVNSYFHTPTILFSYAQEIGSLISLEKLSQRKAIQRLANLRPEQKIFINLSSQTISSADLISESFLELLQEKKLSPNNIVFEITERNSIQNFNNFNKLMSTLKNKGFSFAIDDAGAGYSSMQAIAELQPNFIKLDKSLVTGINNAPIKEALVEAFVTFSKRINSALIAEGIETREELYTLIKLGVDYGQGYFLGKPLNEVKQIAETKIGIIKRLNQKNTIKLTHNPLTVGGIVQSCPIIVPTTTVEEVLHIFQGNTHLEGIVVAKEMAPLGLVMRSHLFSLLSTRYSVPLYYKRPIYTIMNANPLIIEEHTTLEKASQIATARQQKTLYDHLVVTGNGLLRGVISIRQLLETITNTKIKIAQYANPLTGLPGNIRIQEEILKINTSNNMVAVTYADLDEFKKFNDMYGFERGDEILLFFSKILTHSINFYSHLRESFLGHIGGDDFLMITPLEHTDNINKKITKMCKRAFKDSLSVSLATIIVYSNRFQNHLELSKQAALAKKEAKKIKGCCYIKESLNKMPPDFQKIC